MAATKNTLMAMWGKSSAVKSKENSSDVLSVHSTRSRAAEERSAPDKEATSRLSKPDIGRSKAGKADQAIDEDIYQTPTQAVSFPHAKGIVCVVRESVVMMDVKAATATCFKGSYCLVQVLEVLTDTVVYAGAKARCSNCCEWLSSRADQEEEAGTPGGCHRDRPQSGASTQPGKHSSTPVQARYPHRQ